MRIALVARGIYPFDFGGREIRIYQLAKNFSERHDVTVFVPDKEKVNYPNIHEGFKIEPVAYSPKSPSLLNSIGGLSFARNVSKILAQSDFDVVDVLFYSMPFDPENTKTVATLNVVLPAWKHVSLRRKIFTLPVVLIRMMLNFGKAHFADKVICVSDSAKEEAIKLRIPENKIEVVKNGVDSNLFNPDVESRVREEYNLSKDTFLILYAGRLVEAKGVQDLVKAFKQMRTEFDVKLMILGEGKYKTHLKELAPEKDVIFLDPQPYEKMPEFYNAADLFILPSYWEVQPLGCVEAMACGTPVISTNVGGIPEIISDGKTGLLFEPGDVIDLEKTIRKILSNPNLKAQLVENGLEFAEDREWRRIAEKTFSVYINLVED